MDCEIWRKQIKNSCDIGKHKLRENKFGVVWCVRCGLLSTALGIPTLEENERITIIKNVLEQ